MTITNVISGTIEVTKGVNEIKSSKLAFAKEALTAASKAGDAITPFIPLIGAAATIITEIIDVYQTAQYNKKICNSILDRARLAEIAIDNIVRRRKENELHFKNQKWYYAFNRFVEVLNKLKQFAEEISQLKRIINFIKARNISERFCELTKEYDDIMKDLNFTMAISNEQQRRIDQKSLKDDLGETSKFLKKIDIGIEENQVHLALIYEEIGNLVTQVKRIDRRSSDDDSIQVKKIESSQLREPAIGKLLDTRGSNSRLIKRKIYMDAIEIALKPIKIPKENPEKRRVERQLAIQIKASQSPNVIRFYGLTEVGSETFMILEWAQLGSLKEMYEENQKQIPLELKLTYALQICRGIAYLNASDVFHHDVRCKNIVVTENNVAKLTNFKISRNVNDTTSTIGSSLEGTRWLAPEKLRDQYQPYNHKCEIFSFGMLLWELAFEQIPYKDMEIHTASDFVISGGRPKIDFGLASEITPIHKGYEKIIREAWYNDPDLRISISKLLIDLDSLVITHTKPGRSPRIPPQNEAEINLSFEFESSSYNDDYGFPESEFNIDELEIEPLIPINEGIKAHKDKDFEKAWKCFDKQAENQNSKGKHWKAHYLWEGIFVPKDKISAIKLFKEAADDGIPDAQLRFAFCLPDKDIRVLNLNPKDSIKYLKLAADSGNDVAQFHLGEAYLKGKLGFNKDLKIAINFFKISALRHNPNAKKKLQELKEQNIDIED
ncbi:16829_t:CDS:2 [Funneliformis geosporum]|uniref:4113_t:CDS:1 n=1 Tax=Funneliformis geosporum TaxID=1117311 RepID=A0A9W4X0R4_9GLOM|nr:16829_t:CDS:2 [Funneliformis geosporum]CAI2186676.1 4113_t:CDS:2 [Funneliformis geosporum]